MFYYGNFIFKGLCCSETLTSCLDWTKTTYLLCSKKEAKNMKRNIKKNQEYNKLLFRTEKNTTKFVII